MELLYARRARALLIATLAWILQASAAHAQATGQLVVQMGDGGAPGTVDGVGLGPSPAVATALLPGAHVVTALHPDGRRLQRIVEVAAGVSVAIELVFAEPVVLPPVATPPPLVATPPPLVAAPPPQTVTPPIMALEPLETEQPPSPPEQQAAAPLMVPISTPAASTERFVRERTIRPNPVERFTDQHDVALALAFVHQGSNRVAEGFTAVGMQGTGLQLQFSFLAGSISFGIEGKEAVWIDQCVSIATCRQGVVGGFGITVGFRAQIPGISVGPIVVRPFLGVGVRALELFAFGGAVGATVLFPLMGSLAPFVEGGLSVEAVLDLDPRIVDIRRGPESPTPIMLGGVLRLGVEWRP